jgi:hypothetical protein
MQMQTPSTDLPGADPGLLREHGDRVLASNALGKTRSYERLFRYLLEASIDGRVPKEIEIAVDVFGKQPDFDVGKDALVRVYIHKLRQKLEGFYRAQSQPGSMRLTIPKGQYRIAIEPAGEPLPATEQAHGSTAPPASAALWTGALLLAALTAIGGWWTGQRSRTDYVSPVERHSFWSSVLDDDTSILLVLGDYFIFGEADRLGGVRRLIRDFSINSKEDFDNYLLNHPDDIGRYENLNLNYLPIGTAFALRDVLPALRSKGHSVDIVPMSELRISDVRSKHVIYVGYLSALSKLSEFVFASSGLAMGETYDEILNIKTGELYMSDAGQPIDGEIYDRDYGLVSSFAGPGGNRFIIIAGTRDAGLMQTAHAMTTPALLEKLDATLSARFGTRPADLEALYEVTGSGRVNLDAVLVYTGKLDYRRIWGGDVPESGLSRR